MGLIELMHAALDAGDTATAALAITAMPGSDRLPPEIIRDLFRIGMKDQPTTIDARKVATVANACEADHV